MKNQIHKAPWGCIFPKESRNKCKIGKRPRSDQEFFEILCLVVLQTGLGWGLVRKNWQKYKRSFFNFNLNKLAKAKAEELMKAPNVIKNQAKIKAIIFNAKEFQKIQKWHGSFSNFLKSSNEFKNKEVFKILTKRFKYIGDYNAEYYLHSIGY